MKAFHAYFKKQWMESEFCNWQIYQTPPGFTTTNNPIESYNGKLKAFFTNRLKLNLVPPLEIFKNDCIIPESSFAFTYVTQKLVTIPLENKAKHLYEYNHVNGQISTINLSNQTCTCSDTIDKGICLPLIRVSFDKS